MTNDHIKNLIQSQMVFSLTQDFTKLNRMIHPYMHQYVFINCKIRDGPLIVAHDKGLKN